ncbi:hypothetical protein [Williamsia sp. 1135]|uniref:hypothetical protein n=1 Tax=Williamsia sp. 1135 TaxID=1889262 RepID=UPI000A11145C|nr:hypothetical protein [Williamsia sp. 1135]ORM35510.1 hypothetical protein BFL43_09320 [Williamsia sp. 1135]
MNPSAELRRLTGPVVTALVALLAVLTVGAGLAAADPATAPGWMPPKPTLTAEQKSWLTPMDEHEDKYQIIKCSDHRDFGECEEHGLREQSKDMYAYIFDTEGNYVGTTGAGTGLPQQLAPEHIELLDGSGVLDCEKARGKIPICSDPTGDPAPAQYDEGGKFIKLTEGGTVTPGAGDVEEKVDLGKLNPLNAGKEMLDNWFAQACESVGKFSGDLLVLSMSWWLKTDSIDISYAGALNGEKPIQTVAMMIIAAGIIGSAIGMMMLRRSGPAAEFALGALKFIMISSLSMIVLSGALHAGDDFAQQITAKGAEEFGPRMREMLGIQTISNPGGVLLLGIVAVVLSFIQWVLGFARQAGIVVLFALLIFAAAGQLAPWGRAWFPKIVGMLTALVLYKPAAAMLYSLAWKLMGTEKSLSAVMVGLMVLALAILSLPTMLAFFSFLTPGIAGGGSAGTALAAGAGGAGMISQMSNSLGSGGDSQSNYMDSTGPGSAPQGPEADPSPGNSPGGPGSGAKGEGNGTGGSEDGAGGEADDGSGADMGPSPAEESPDAGGGIGTDSGADGGVPVAGSAEGGAAGAEAAGGAAAANPYVAGAMAAKEAAGEVQSGADSLATESLGGSSGENEFGPDMP